MSFPTSPINGQTAVVNNITYQYTATNNSWKRIPTAAVYTSLSAAGNVTVGDSVIAGNVYTDNLKFANGAAFVSTTIGNTNEIVANIPSGNNVGLTLADTSVVAGNYGSSTSIPTIVVDSKGRVTSLTTNAVSTTITLNGTSGSGSVAGGGTLTFAGTYGVTATASSSTITVGTPQDLRSTANPSFAALTTNGNINVGGNVNISSGNINLLTGNINSTVFIGNSGFFIGNTSSGYGALYAGIPSGFAVLPSTPFEVATNGNTYSQMNMQNINNGSLASTDYVVTAGNGTDSTYYGDFGIASNTYSYPALGITAVGPNDTYLLGVGYSAYGPYTGNVGNVVISSSNGMIKLASGGANISNVIVTVTGTGVSMVGNVTRNNRAVVTNYSGNVAPSSPIMGDEWFRGNTGVMYKYLYDNVSNTYNWLNISSALYNASTSAVANTLALRDSGGNLTATNFLGTASSAKYADLAEIYTSDKNYEPGTVVVFGGTAEITATKITHDTRVAGVISTNPAYLMNSEAAGLPVAFTGRVPCKVRGPVAKGDVLVTSAYPEYAERMTNTLYRPGCILGKSLSDVAENVFATVEVVVGRF
jgi:hypothetical protein